MLPHLPPPPSYLYTLALLIAGFCSFNAMGQPIYYSSATDVLLGAANAAKNTGFDMRYDNGCLSTATVWDGVNGGIAVSKTGDYYATTWTTLIGQRLSDPDVVTGYYNGTWYVMAVGVDTNNRITVVKATPYCSSTMGLRLNNVSTCVVGIATASSVLPPSTTRRCYSPNIDVNSAGQVAIVWAERADYVFTFTPPTPPFAHSTPSASVGYYTSNIFATHGYINATLDGTHGTICGGTGKDCNRQVIDPATDMPAYSSWYPITTKVELDHWNADVSAINPDVAIKDGSHATVSYAYMEGGKLKVYQHEFQTCPDTLGFTIDSCFTGFVGNKPRIAMKPSPGVLETKDYVVVGGTSSDCDGYNQKGIITAVTKEMGSTHCPNVADTLNNNIDLTTNQSLEPVVSYSTQTGDLTWLVAWTMAAADPVKNPSGDTEGKYTDIVARHYYTNGTPHDSHHYYTFVNTVLDSNQFAPSVAARFAESYNGFAFIGSDTGGSQAYHKLSPDIAGQSGLNTEPSYSESCPNCLIGYRAAGTASDSIILYPNPGREQFSIGFSKGIALRKGTIKLTDSKGLTVLTQAWNAAEGQPKVSVKDLLPGMYNVSFTDESGKVRRKIFIKN